MSDLKTREEVLDADGSISLTKLTGRKIVDIVGDVGRPFDDWEPEFIIEKIVFDDGSVRWVGGSTDIAYVEFGPSDSMVSEDQLYAVSDEEFDEDDEEDEDE